MVTTVAVLLFIGTVAFANRDALFGFLAKSYTRYVTEQETSHATSTERVSTIEPAFVSQESQAVRVVKKVNPAVVSIVITKDVPIIERYFEGGSPLDDFFGFNFQLPKYRQKGTEKREVGGGSGFLVNRDGLIITNRHVVADDTAEYTVFTNDGKKYPAEVLAKDPVLDVAVVKISGGPFASLTLGNSDTLEVGQSVVAIGNALAEFRNTVSVGVISGLGRSITAGDSSGGVEQLDEVIQTDAAINPGNSGGPLVNLRGEVIGVNVAVAEGSQNIGFSLPINSIKGVISSVERTGTIVRPYVGIRYVIITKELKEKNNLPVDYGILITRGKDQTELAVMPGSPANKAGLLENDIILAVDGVKISVDRNFSSMIRKHAVGDVIKLKILSKGVEREAMLVLEKYPQ